jgi:hypothetical protein
LELWVSLPQLLHGTNGFCMKNPLLHPVLTIRNADSNELSYISFVLLLHDMVSGDIGRTTISTVYMSKLQCCVLRVWMWDVPGKNQKP